MFWRKKSSSASAAAAERSISAISQQAAQPPKPILKVNTEGSGGPNIRFAGQAKQAEQQQQMDSPTLASGPGLAGVGSGLPRPRVREGMQTPRVVVSQYETYSSPQVPTLNRQRQSSYDAMTAQPRVPSPSQRRSSRPTSPSATSFGARARASTEPVNIAMAFPPSPAQSIGAISSSSGSSSSSPVPRHEIPLATPPMPSSHVTTPPTAYVSSFQSRAPPPPSPYRPTNERARSSSVTRNLPEQLPMMETFAPMSARDALFPSDSRASVHTLPGQGVPMLNVIPATPQDMSDEFPGASASSSDWRKTSTRPTTKLEDAVKLDEMDEVPLHMGGGSALEGVPSIDVDLHFSPFEGLSALPDTDIATPALRTLELAPEPEVEEDDAHTPLVHARRFSEDVFDEEYERDTDDTHAPSDPLPPSPPFPSYPSLPSLTSQASMQTSGSETSMPTSDSMSSLVSFPDVEEALGSMLASLSDSNMSTTTSMPLHAPVKDVADIGQFSGNPGLGLGLDIADQPLMSTTAPLSPRRRAPPAPLDLSFGQVQFQVGGKAAPPIINHRVAFYGTAKAHPNSPSSGIFTSCSSSASSCSSSSTISLGLHERSASSSSTSSMSLAHEPEQGQRYASFRDSISMASEASDEDLHTASIISLTPIMGPEGQVKEMREEILGSPRLDDEQAAAVAAASGLGLGLSFGLGGRLGMGMGLEVEHEVGVAL